MNIKNGESMRFCKKCLLVELTDEKSLYDLIRDQISLMDEEKRTTDAEYRHRLAICETCDHLNRGTCVKCGCYVELRAAKRHMSCPCLPAKWQAVKVAHIKTSE